MTEVEKLTLLRVMVGQPNEGEWSDDVLTSYLAIAGRKIINRAYPYDDTVDEVPRRYGYLQCDIANYLLNKRGAEGQTGHSENGVNRSYESADVPESMLSEISPHVGVL
jgi:hypothetical protein